MKYKLKTDVSEAVVSEHGGEFVSFRLNGTEYVWQGLPEYWKGQAPILFPVCCAPKDGKIAFDGVEYPMTKHGFVRNTDLQTIMLSKDKITFEKRENEETLKMFPFRFSLKITYELLDDGWNASFTVTNLDDKDMTYCIGGHPAFAVPFNEGEKFEDYSLIFDDASGCTVSLTYDGYMNPDMPLVDKLKNTNELPLNYSDYDNDCMIVENLHSKKVKLINRNTQHGISFDFDSFNALGLWTPIKKNAPFFCIEPWNGLPAGTNETVDAKSKKYATTLKPGESSATGYKVRVI